MKRKKLEEVAERTNVALSREANAAITAMLDRFGGKKVEVAERVIRWFASLPESIQQVAIGRVPNDMHTEFLQKVNDYFAELVGEPATKADDAEPTKFAPSDFPAHSEPQHPPAPAEDAARKRGPKSK